MTSSFMKKVTLKSSDGEIFEVDDAFVNESAKIKHLSELTDDAIPLPNISSETLSKVIVYVKKHIELGVAIGMASGRNEERLKAWDAKFMNVDMDTLYNLVTAAYDLGIKSLLDLACLRTAEIIKGKTPDQIRKTFNIKSDLTPKEEEEEEEEEDRKILPSLND